MKKTNDSIIKLRNFIESENFKGYDPYDTLNSSIPLIKMGKWIPALATQFQKRNPLNIRPLLGIKKGYNPKGMGLMLKAYCLDYKRTGDFLVKQQADFLFKWLSQNYSKRYSGHCWGYNFAWANPQRKLKAYTPSVVVTAFVIDGIMEYYKLTESKEAKDIIISSTKYIVNDLPLLKFKDGWSISYTEQSSGACYNASLLGAETLVKAYSLNGDKSLLEIASKCVDFVLSKQNSDGSWYYSFNEEKDTERKQIDFHQGFILVSLHNYLKYSKIKRADVEKAILEGLLYYRNAQFFDNGISKWRIPKQWPIEIHNQSQGIITFSMLREYGVDFSEFAHTISEWTIGNMQDDLGYFYYQFHKYYKIKIPYMRWSQAWMLLSLNELLKTR